MPVDKLDKMLVGMTTNLEQIVSQSSYRSTLKGVSTNSTTYTNDIRKISKSYEDTFLRQCVGENERQCVRGAECECMKIDTSMPFVGVEYVLPWEEKHEAQRGMCLPCSRATTHARNEKSRVCVGPSAGLRGALCCDRMRRECARNPSTDHPQSISQPKLGIGNSQQSSLTRFRGFKAPEQPRRYTGKHGA
jgi:hypothetical protein